LIWLAATADGAGAPDEIGPLAVYLASPAAAYVTGAAYVIDGGYTLWCAFRRSDAERVAALVPLRAWSMYSATTRSPAARASECRRAS